MNTSLDFKAPDSATGTNVYVLTVVATDDGKPVASQQLQVSVMVARINEEPVGAPVSLIELTAGNPPTTIDLDELFTDPDGDTLTFTIDDYESPPVASALVENNILSITPLEDGIASFLVTATDATELSVTATVDVFVASPPPLPTVASTPMPLQTVTPVPVLKESPALESAPTFNPVPRPISGATRVLEPETGVEAERKVAPAWPIAIIVVGFLLAIVGTAIYAYLKRNR